MLSILKKFADNRQQGTLADRLRNKRFKKFIDLIDQMPRPIRIIDLGGTWLFWSRMGFAGKEGIEITLVNIRPDNEARPGFVNIHADVRDLRQFTDREFDVAFSNSVIEHLECFEDQQKMATEMKRVAKRIFLQTPNRYFPLEPHFLFPFFQFLPLRLKVWLVMNFNLGWFEKTSDKNTAIRICRSIRLMTKSELRRLFPNALIHREWFFGMVKSFIVIRQ